jgi:murein DD-endopeptidase MepM/ murein hydrolase activator NlpD
MPTLLGTKRSLISLTPRLRGGCARSEAYFTVLTVFSFFTIRLLLLACSLAVSTNCFAFGKFRPAREKGFAQDKAPAVKVCTQREGPITRFYVENDELCEITMSFDVDILNLTSTAKFPYTATFPPGKTTEAFTLTPTATETNWEFSYTNYYKLGSSCAAHDDSATYRLPYAPGTRYKVSQGYNGGFSHKGSNQYAIDWQMPEGTPVFAARGGLVVKVKDDSSTGGSSMKYDPYNNYVLIRHSDGTLGHYCHLQKGGVPVKAGQAVNAGQLIAHSGNTGFSSGPHLHFSVFKTKNGRERISLPVKFQTGDGKPAVLVEGRRYTAPDIQTASATTPSTSGPGS